MLNIRSLHPKYEELKYFLQTHRFDILGLNETWLDESFRNEELEIPDYDLVRKDRNRHGGGVCFYIRSELKYKVLTEIDCNIELLWLSIDL